MSVGVKALVIYNKKIILILRDNKPTIPDPNTWGLPGGQVESNESYDDALQREVYEELHIKPLSFKFIGKQIISNDNQVMRYVIWLSDKEAFEIHLGNEGQEFRLVSVNEALKLPLSSVSRRFFSDHREHIREIVEQGKEIIPEKLGLLRDND